MIPDNNFACIGCKACASLCPKGAISFNVNEKGFEYPYVDKELCINCGLCDDNCCLNNRDRVKHSPLMYYALKSINKQERMRSSSGGFFLLLAKEILSKNGVVYGCYLNDDIIAIHGRAEKYDDIIPFTGSKYVQSDMGNIANSIIADLKEGRLVLFTGTPCQCLAVKKVTEKVKSGKLVLCDFYCHGAPSPMVFESYKEFMEKKYNGRIKALWFRDKEKPKYQPSSRGIRMQIDDGIKILDIYDSKSNDKYYEMFKFNYISRESCYECPCIGYDRDSDFTIGDYWGCEKYHPEFFDNKGISVVSINTELGLELFGGIQDKVDYIEIQKNEIFQPMLTAPPQKKDNYDKVWECFMKHGFEKASELCRKSNREPLIIRLKCIIRNLLPLRFVNFYKKIVKSVNNG